jgi:hypothetical protein
MELTGTPSTPSSASARVHQRPTEQDIEPFMSGLLLILVAWSLPIQSGPDLFHTAPHSTGNAHPRPQPQAALTRSTAKGPFPRTATCRPGPRGRRPAEPLPAEAWLDRARGASCRPGFWTSRCPTPVSLLLPSSTRRKTSNGCGTCERVPTLRRQAGDVRGASSVRGVGLDLESPEDRLRSIRRNRATGPLRIRARIRIRQLPTESRIALPWPGCGLPGRSQATIPRVHGFLLNPREEPHGRTQGEQR